MLRHCEQWHHCRHNSGTSVRLCIPPILTKVTHTLLRGAWCAAGSAGQSAYAKESAVTATPTGPEGTAVPPAPQPESVEPAKPHVKQVHQVTFVTYPKLLFIWPVILLGFVFWPLGYRGQQPIATAGGPATTVAQPAGGAAGAVAGQPPTVAAAPHAGISHRHEILAWLYILAIVLVLLTLGVDVGRNMAAFWVVLVAGLWVLGIWLRDMKHFTLFGDIYRWFANLDLQYEPRFGLALSIILLVPFVLMLGWARLNERWRITHNEFEHRAWGKSDDSLGRGAKTIRVSYPDIFEWLLGLAGTLTVYNATGTKELRRIPHVMFLPFVNRRLSRILESTSITMGQAEEEEDEENP